MSVRFQQLLSHDAVLCLLYCASSTVPALLCQLYCASSTVPALLCLLYCASSTVPALLCQLYCASSTVPALLCQLYCASSTVPALLFCHPKASACSLVFSRFFSQLGTTPLMMKLQCIVGTIFSIPKTFLGDRHQIGGPNGFRSAVDVDPSVNMVSATSSCDLTHHILLPHFASAQILFIDKCFNPMTLP